MDRAIRPGARRNEREHRLPYSGKDLQCRAVHIRTSQLYTWRRELRYVLEAQRGSPKSEMAKAIAYGRKRWVALTRFLDDDRLEIDNNIAERVMRCVAVGRTNWLFAGPKAGGDRAAAIYSVIETAKLNGLEPQVYITDVIAKIAGNWPAIRWDELMPWNWRPDNEVIAQAA